LIHNFANAEHAGGGALNGRSAQEEVMFFRTNYSTSLISGPPLYEIKDKELIYTPKVTVIKNTDYEMLQQPFKVVDMVACAAQDFHLNLNNGKMHNYINDEKELMQDKINAVFEYGIITGHKDIIVGAFGCGAFAHNPDEVVELYNNAIGRYRIYYENIVFGILGNPNFAIFNTKIKK
jgi:uncharacterized protein (TIGR02452 family)